MFIWIEYHKTTSHVEWVTDVVSSSVDKGEVYNIMW